MNYLKHLPAFKVKTSVLLLAPIMAMMGCGSDSDDDSIGYFQLYNTSANSPAIYLTVDQYDDDDYSENTHTAVSYTNVGSRLEYETDNYDIELAWYDDSDLEIIHQENVKVTSDNLQFILLSEDITSPSVVVYDIDIRDDDEIEEDGDDDLFNIRFLNAYQANSNIDIYMSDSDETFNEAELVSQVSYQELSENTKFEEDEYVFYITNAGETEVLFETNEISFPYSAEYIFSVRENKGAGDSPFVLDQISTSSVTEHVDTASEAEFKVYNGVTEHELLPGYNGTVNLHIDGVDDTPEVYTLAYGKMSELIEMSFGDYSLSLVSSADDSSIIKNHLLTLNENSNKTIFFYLLEEEVDLDGDGNVDENNDGIVDEIEISVNSLVVENSQSEGLYSHNMNVVNLIDDEGDDFSSVSVYFVKSDEIIDTADSSVTVPFATSQSINLLNNTYDVIAIGKQNTSNIILSTNSLVLDEESVDQFLILKNDPDSITGYSIEYISQGE